MPNAFPAAKRITLPARVNADGSEAPAITLSVHDSGKDARGGPVVVFSHGFPELAYSWRLQFEALVDAGFRVIAPDQRGYGESDAPEEIERYDLAHLCGDLATLLDVLEIEQAVFAGHDWGGFVVWAMPLLYPTRTLGVIGVNTPYLARSEQPPTQMLRLAQPDPEKLYILWFQQPGVAEAAMAPHARRCFELLMRRPLPPDQMLKRMIESGGDMNPFRRLDEIGSEGPMGEVLLGPEELSIYTETFEQTGFRGGINWYRNMDRNWERLPKVGTEKIPVPCLMVTAEWDMALPPALAAGMPALCPDLETVMIEQCGHWTQQEKPEAFNRILVDWLTRRIEKPAPRTE